MNGLLKMLTKPHGFKTWACTSWGFGPWLLFSVGSRCAVPGPFSPLAPRPLFWLHWSPSVGLAWGCHAQRPLRVTLPLPSCMFLFFPSAHPSRLQVLVPQGAFSNHPRLNLEKAMAPRSRTLAWRIPWTEEPGGLQSVGSLRVGHDWETSLSCIGEGNDIPLQCSCLENARDGSLVGCHLWGRTESDTTEAT